MVHENNMDSLNFKSSKVLWLCTLSVSVPPIYLVMIGAVDYELTIQNSKPTSMFDRWHKLLDILSNLKYSYLVEIIADLHKRLLLSPADALSHNQ